jgi:hypothetical protein
MDKKGVWGVIILLIIGAIAFFVGFMPVYQHNVAVQENQPVNATVIGTDIEVQESDDDTDYKPVIRYQYTVEGETYTSNNVWPGQFGRTKGSRGGAQEVISDYEAGSDTTRDGEQVTAYYNPDNPGDAYLRNDDGWPGVWWVITGYAVVVFLAGIYYIRKGFKRWRQRTLIADTPTEQAEALSIGPSEIKGTAITDDLTTMSAPFSEDDCVLAKYEIEEYYETDDSSGWKTVDEGVVHTEFYVDDGTGQVLVEPHDDAVYDLEPEDWSKTYVDSGNRGPGPVQQFVQWNDDVSFPSDAGGKENDRKYRQNLIRNGEDVYVLGTVHPKDETVRAASNAERLLIRKTDEDSSLREPTFIISDDKERNLINRRRWALWRAPVGAFFMVGGFATLLILYAPVLGLQTPVLF